MKLRKGLKRFAAILLVCTILMSLFPIGAMATDSITVYVTISDKGALAEGTDGKPMGYRAVTVTDWDEDRALTIYDAYTAAHKQFCQSEFALNGSGLVGQLWGDRSGSFLTFVNNAGIGGTPLNEQPIADGAHLVGAILSDTSLWSDHYSFFSSLSKTVPKNAAFELSLTSFQGMSGAASQSAPLLVPKCKLTSKRELTANLALQGCSRQNFQFCKMRKHLLRSSLLRSSLLVSKVTCEA